MADNQTISQTPKNVLLAVRIIWVTIALNIIRWCYDIFQMPESSFMNNEFFKVIGIACVVFLFQIWVAKNISTGDKVARLLFILLLFMGLRTWLPTIVEDFDHSILQSSFHIILTLAQVVALILLFTKDVNAWFNEQHALKVKKPKAA
ncbi:MAG: hypothetical protein K2Y18_08900 [Alphaproteobacteria bacterium]|jgi:hypothetical protein|nr:hypothetical protein [Alphaproteobacteria bacterium]